MKNLFHAEWERLWSLKITWIFIFSIPMILIASAKYYYTHNEIYSKENPAYTYANSFSIMGLSEQLSITFNIIILVIIGLTFAQEYHSGQMRLILQRAYSFQEIVIAKMFSISLFILIFLSLYFVFSYIIGFIVFDPKEQIILFYHKTPTEGINILFYNITYYLLAYLCLLAISSVFIMLSIISKSTTGALSLGMGFFMFSFLYPSIIESFNLSDYYLMFTSLTMLEFKGIALILAENPFLATWNISVLLLYIIICNSITLFLSKKKDLFI